jgi:hypothetical protein
VRLVALVALQAALEVAGQRAPLADLGDHGERPRPGLRAHGVDESPHARPQRRLVVGLHQQPSVGRLASACDGVHASPSMPASERLAKR